MDKTMMQIYKEMGVNRLASVKPVKPQTIKAHIDKYVKAKAEHIDNGSQCERGAIGGCTACHFWSGAISALTELLAQHGYEDSHERIKELEKENRFLKAEVKSGDELIQALSKLKGERDEL